MISSQLPKKPAADRLVLGNVKKLSWAALVLLFSAAPLAQAREKDKKSYGEGLIINVPYPEAEVEQVVQDVAQNGIIRGTKEYNKDENIGGAHGDISEFAALAKNRHL